MVRNSVRVPSPKWQISLFFFLLFIFPLFCLADELIIEPDNGRAPLLTAIEHAQSSIQLSLYGFTDTTILQALMSAKNHGKEIRILLEPNPYQADGENTDAIHALQQAHIPLHWPSTQFKFLHQKTFLFDHSSALIMTFNLTHSSFQKERNFALLITNPAMVEEIQRVFDADWKQQTVSVENPNLVWSPDNSRRKILAFIQQAQSSIKIYTQTMTDYEIIGALAQAARAKVKVQILLSMLPKKQRLNYLTRAGVTVHRSHHYLIHAKVLVIDQKKAMLGSINLTQTSLNENRELSIITDNPHIVRQLVDTFDHDFTF